MNRRRLFSLGLGLIAAATLAACSGPYTVSSEVATYGSWAEARKPGSFAFDRLPSQQENGQVSALQARMEDSARAALQKAGFTEAPEPKSADYLVSLGARIQAQDRAPWDDPLWWRWHGSYSSWRFGYGPGAWPYRSGFGLGFAYPVDVMDRRFDRSVAVLIRDRQSAEPLFEARASNEGATQGDAGLLGAMFSAALSEFPKVDPKPRRVSVQAMR
ncbi:hypothetical protein HNP55_004518 [Paucibacter oligotrophus]|uniref:DUF4136 domain-containing protein n=1 Tax=Roseateles oligotrophus TaxID=1769250 RepID=A0A840LBI9_9BURK|nr:DUF4136 domain-containing protein [Roseateles oligotrophus]MBB4845964.1 hypothetical protein [Roseateles oligotrophus]